MNLKAEKIKSVYNMKKYFQHFEIYDDDIMSNQYEVIDSPEAKNHPSNWHFCYSCGGVGHPKTIEQSKDITCGRGWNDLQDNKCTATISLVKYKKFYDFKLTLDFKAY